MERKALMIFLVVLGCYLGVTAIKKSIDEDNKLSINEIKLQSLVWTGSIDSVFAVGIDSVFAVGLDSIAKERYRPITAVVPMSDGDAALMLSRGSTGHSSFKWWHRRR